MSKVYSETFRRVGIEGIGCDYEIGPDADCADCVGVRFRDWSDKEVSPKWSMSMPVEQARAIAAALIACADEIDLTKGGAE